MKKNFIPQKKWKKGWSYSVEGMLSTGPTPSSFQEFILLQGGTKKDLDKNQQIENTHELTSHASFF